MGKFLGLENCPICDVFRKQIWDGNIFMGGNKSEEKLPHI